MTEEEKSDFMAGKNQKAIMKSVFARLDLTKSENKEKKEAIKNRIEELLR